MGAAGEKPNVVVIGNGMVGHRFAEKFLEFGGSEKFQLTVFGEEIRPAYDRVHLSEYFAGKSAEDLSLTTREWYSNAGFELITGDKVVSINNRKKTVTSESGKTISYDKLVLATGSDAFVPPIPGVEKKGVFVYRTIEDLEAITAWAEGKKTAAVMGGGLLGLEAAKAMVDLGLKTHVIEFAPRLMPRQIDTDGSKILVEKIESLGVEVHLGMATSEIAGKGQISSLKFKEGNPLDVDMLVISAGIRPRDELGKSTELAMGPRGGITIDNFTRTSDDNIYAIGEVALHEGMIYGLVAPGYEMAEVAASEICGKSEGFTAEERPQFKGGDLSAKLKLMGVDVANFGDAFGETKGSRTIVYQNQPAGVYKRLTISQHGEYLLGGMLVGDASEYNNLLQFQKNKVSLSKTPEDLILGARGDEDPGMSIAFLPDSAQICSCNNICKGDIVEAVRDGVTEIGPLKSCTKAGTGCGGCLPMVQDILNGVLESEGKTISNHLCEHFPYSRAELYDIVRVTGIKSYPELLEKYGKGKGCEVCKPAVASILASVHNEWVVEHQALQDTNDRYLGNIQKNGTYSVVPRVPGGEILPDQLITLGQVAKKYDLYCKITGGQRVDLFGARVDQLPDIWEELIEAGFESGQAYAKSLRTIKSCVGSTWCRFGVQDSVGFAIQLENRYKGLRAPHKLKSACSGCVRECAEAQSKDFGVVATENGYNLYVCGNGGAKPQHAVLLATDIDEETCVKYLDRFLMYYIKTADKLTRTAAWFNKLDGGLDHLKDVIINDSLGICDELEKQMQHVVDTYECEWKKVVETPEKRKLFTHFANSVEPDETIRWVPERGQKKPLLEDEMPSANGAETSLKKMETEVAQ